MYKTLLKYHIYINIQTLYSILCWSTFGSLKSSCVIRYKLSTPVRLDGERHWSAIFRSLQRCSIGFKSGLWLGHSRTIRDLSSSHSCVVLAVCLGSLSRWKVNLRPSLRSWPLWSKFSSRISLFLLCSSFPWSWLVSQSLLLKNYLTAWCCHHQASL